MNVILPASFTFDDSKGFLICYLIQYIIKTITYRLCEYLFPVLHTLHKMIVDIINACTGMYIIPHKESIAYLVR